MKKNAFTLSEVIISLTVIGIVAVMCLPLINNVFPDKDKIKVLKLYKTITSINEEFLSDSGLYLSNGACTGFNCQELPSAPPYRDLNNTVCADDNKYPYLFMKRMHETNETTPNGVEGLRRFTTEDGMYWDVYDDPSLGNDFKVIITVDLNGNNEGADCSYTASTCEEPDRFVFSVDVNGNVRGEDALTRAYLLNPYKVNDKKNDYKKAASL